MQKDNEKTLGSWGVSVNSTPRAAFQRQGGQSSSGKQQSQVRQECPAPGPGPASPHSWLLLDPFRSGHILGCLLLSLGPWDAASSGFNPLQKFLSSRGLPPAPPLKYPLDGEGLGSP